MGVGDYIHSKEAPRPPTRDVPNQSRQLLAEQAKVDIPGQTSAASIHRGVNGRAHPEQQNGAVVIGQPHGPYEEPAQGDMFDTDVEGVDDSTIAATTVLDPEEGQLPPSRQGQHDGINNRPLNHFRPGHRHYGSKWYENLGDKAMKTAGFESDDADDDESQLASSLADDDDDDKASETTDWYYSHKHHPGEEPLSRRLENFWNASKRAYPKPLNPVQSESHLPVVPLASEAKKPAAAAHPLAEGRKVTLPRNHTATPRARSRFSPPKPSLLEQLDITPTRGSSGQRGQPTGKNGTSAAAIPQPNDMDDARLFTNDNYSRENNHPATAFDMTNMDFLDNEDDETIQDPFSKHPRTKKTSIDHIVPKKRDFETDYPPEILYQKSFSDLQAEPFDRTPPPAASPAAETQKPQPGDSEDKVSLLLRLSGHDRANYLSNLPIDEWEECGDQLVEQFGQTLTRMKDLRRARRKTVAIFEAEIKRRHELVDDQAAELEGKLDDMRNGGVEVLRGRPRT